MDFWLYHNLFFDWVVLFILKLANLEDNIIEFEDGLKSEEDLKNRVYHKNEDKL